MKNLLILRHAKSSWNHPELSDHDRPLNKRGKHDAPRMGALIAELGLTPDAIYSSTARRARDTALIVAEACGFAGEIQFDRDLYHAGLETFSGIIRGLENEIDCVLLVGHNPDLEELVDWFADDAPWLPTAALVQIEFPIQIWSDLDQEPAGRLCGIWRPRELSGFQG